MSIQLQCNNGSLADKKDAEIHLMPCKINHDGCANVSGFFTPYINGNNHYVNKLFRNKASSVLLSI